uniref:Pyruvate phosphate dikinase AMP/ATP-binding domain-containing protein n=1 Tax=Chrysotila carterae TaxID=13221 RepID=A0A6S9V7X9_CHRCT
MGFFSSAAAAAIRFSGTGRTALQRLAVPSATRPIARSLCGAPAPAPTLRLDPVLEGVISRFKKSAARASSDETSLVEVFSKLQARRVKKVLLLCSDYDSYTIEEEGVLSEVVYHEYVQLNLRTPPIIERVSSPEKALVRLKETQFDLVVTLLRNASSFVSKVHHSYPSLPIALLAMSATELSALDPRVGLNQSTNVNKRLMWESVNNGDETAAAAEVTGKLARSGSYASSLSDAWIWPFLWQGNTSLFTGMFKLVEDRLNAQKDTSYGVQLILLVEDSVKFYSSYLSVLYGELLKQSMAVANETMAAKEKLMRMYSRPKILLCTNYEEAMDIYERYADNVIGVITDAGFPRNGQHDPLAGVVMAQKMLEQRPELPLMLQSAQGEDSEVARRATAIGAKFASKGSSSLLMELRDFMTEEMKFGPLVFRDANTSKALGTVSTVTQLLSTWEQLPLSSVAYHARRADLSKWFLARSEFQLAKRFRASNYPGDFIDSNGKERPDWLRNWILSEARANRNKLASNVENVQYADPSLPIVRLGSGALGGKGRGLRFLNSLVEEYGLENLMPDLQISVPRCFILATGVYDRFMEENNLLVPALNAKDDEEVLSLFSEAKLPADVMDQLHTYLASMTKPLAVRSSSLFEDAFLRPFAGVYATTMLPNSSPSIATRVKELAAAVKRVYASTHKKDALAYAEMTGNRAEEEKMAVILQEIVGTEQDGYYYPTLAGVANSIDFYPPSNAEPQHGCAQIALGLGSAVVDGMPCVQHLNLGLPSRPVGADESMMPVTALDLSAPVHMGAFVESDSEGAGIVQLPPEFGVMRTFPRSAKVEVAPEAAHNVPGLMHDVHGEQVVFKHGYNEAHAIAPAKKQRQAATLSRISLKQLIQSEVPLPQALSFMLRLCSLGLGCPVELEFALKLRKTPDAKHELHILQVRPQSEVTASHHAKALRFKYLPGSDYSAVASTHALGHGSFENISDVIYVSPETYASCSREQIAQEISALNKKLRAEGRRYLIMSPGRWGNADGTRGVPVKWSDIDGAGFIVETAVEGESVPLSQGTRARMFPSCAEARLRPCASSNTLAHARTRSHTRARQPFPFSCTHFCAR